MLPKVGREGSAMFITGSMLELPGCWLVPEALTYKRLPPEVLWNAISGERFQYHSSSPVIPATLKLFEYVSLRSPFSLDPNVMKDPSLNLYCAVTR